MGLIKGQRRREKEKEMTRKCQGKDVCLHETQETHICGIRTTRLQTDMEGRRRLLQSGGLWFSVHTHSGRRDTRESVTQTDLVVLTDVKQM